MATRNIPSGFLNAWADKRARGRTSYLWRSVCWGTLFLWQVIFLTCYYMFHLHRNSPSWALWLKWAAVLLTPVLCYALSASWWKNCEKLYQEAIAGTGHTPASSSPVSVAIKIETPSLPDAWPCTPEGHRIIVLFVWIAAGTLASFLVQFIIEGSLITFPLLITAGFLLLTPAALEGGCRLNRRDRRIHRWYGILFPWWGRAIPYADIRELRVARGKRPGNRNTTWSHVAAVTDRGSILLRRYDYLPETQKFAEQIAREVSLPSITLST
jgi:hypothetical protein